jgi:hypothetical protein
MVSSGLQPSARIVWLKGIEYHHEVGNIHVVTEMAMAMFFV